MTKPVRIVALGLAVLVGLTAIIWFQFAPESAQDAAAVDDKPFKQAPVRGMVTMIDLGATSCIPCKMMAPILEKMEKKYQGKAAIVFIDVWKDPAPAKEYNIRAIPTQIFFDKDGQEVYRHEGFMSEEAIEAQLKSMGVPAA